MGFGGVAAFEQSWKPVPSETPNGVNNKYFGKIAS